MGRIGIPGLAICVFATFAQPDIAQVATPPSMDHIVHGLVRAYRAGPEDSAPARLSDSGRLESLTRAGNLYLSLRDAIAAAIENDIELEAQRYARPLAVTDVQRAKAGHDVRNALSGNGTAGTSAAGDVLPLDPVMTGTLGLQRFGWQSEIIPGASGLLRSSSLYSFGVEQGFRSGTLMRMGFDNSLFSLTAGGLGLARSGSMDVSVRQRLLRGFGIAVNDRNLKVALNNLSAADLTFRQQAMQTVATVIRLYWDLVAFHEDLALRKKALTLAEKLYADNRQQVEAGTLAPIEMIRADAEVALREQEVIVARTRILQQESTLKGVLSRTGGASAALDAVSIIPTDHIELAETEKVQPFTDLVESALQSRPELARANLQIKNARVLLRGAKNALLPSLDAFADARSRQAPATVVGTSVEPGSLTGGDIRQTGLPLSIGGLAAQLLSGGAPDYTVGFQLTIPLRNRAAQAEYAAAELNVRRDELERQHQVNNIRLEIRNALIALEQARAHYKSAEKTCLLQEQTLEVENAKHALGATTVFLVIQAQRDLAAAHANRVAALAEYARARTQLDAATGSILDVNGIDMDEAFRGSLSWRPSNLEWQVARKVPGLSGVVEAAPAPAAEPRMDGDAARQLPYRTPPLLFTLEPVTDAVQAALPHSAAVTSVRPAHAALSPGALARPARNAAVSAKELDRAGRSYIQTGRYQDAIRTLTAAIEADPGFALAYNARGYARFLVHDYGNALADFDQAIRLNPEYANAFWNRGNTRQRVGDPAGANSDLAKAAEMQARLK